MCMDLDGCLVCAAEGHEIEVCWCVWFFGSRKVEMVPSVTRQLTCRAGHSHFSSGSHTCPKQTGDQIKLLVKFVFVPVSVVCV